MSCHLLARIDVACGLVLPVGSSSLAELSPLRSMVFFHVRWGNIVQNKLPVLVLVVNVHSPVAFEFVYSLQYSLVQLAPCLKTRNIEETNQCRCVSPWLWMSLVVLLAGCCCAWPLVAAVPLRLCATLLLPCCRLVLPCPLGRMSALLAMPVPAQARLEVGPGLLAWPGAAGLRKGRRADTAPSCRCPQPPARCGVRGWLVAAARYNRGPAGIGLQLNQLQDTCDDGHAHAGASSSHGLSYAYAHGSLCGIALKATRRSQA